MFWCRHCRAEMPHYSPLLPNFCNNCQRWEKTQDDPQFKHPYIVPAEYEPDLDHEDDVSTIIGVAVVLLPIWYFFSFKWYIILMILTWFIV